MGKQAAAPQSTSLVGRLSSCSAQRSSTQQVFLWPFSIVVACQTWKSQRKSRTSSTRYRVCFLLFVNPLVFDVSVSRIVLDRTQAFQDSLARELATGLMTVHTGTSCRMCMRMRISAEFTIVWALLYLYGDSMRDVPRHQLDLNAKNMKPHMAAARLADSSKVCSGSTFEICHERSDTVFRGCLTGR